MIRFKWFPCKCNIIRGRRSGLFEGFDIGEFESFGTLIYVHTIFLKLRYIS